MFHDWPRWVWKGGVWDNIKAVSLWMELWWFFGGRREKKVCLHLLFWWWKNLNIYLIMLIVPKLTTTGEVSAIFVCFSSLCIKKKLKNSAPTARAEFVYHVPVEVSLHDTFCIGHRFSLVCRAPGICIAELIGKAWICTIECIFRFSCCYSISSSQPN